MNKQTVTTKQIADIILTVFNFDGYKGHNLYRNDSKSNRIQNKVIATINGGYNEIYFFKKSSTFSFGTGYNVPDQMIIKKYNFMIIVIYDSIVYGIKDNEVIFTKEF